jgi:hypothetical protein
MSNLVQRPNITSHELALVQNDLSKLSPTERLSLYNKTCESLGLNPLTQPFGYIEFRGGKLSLYAKKDCTDQLRKIHGVSVVITSKETIGDNFVVMAKAKDSAGREDEDMGSVSIKGLHGEALGNAMMKAITKAKRRVTLSICGLGMLDETEVETVPNSKDVTPSVQEAVAFPTSSAPVAPKESKGGGVENNGAPELSRTAPPPNLAPTTRLDSYKTTFAFGTFQAGKTFKQLGAKDTTNLLNAIKAWKLKKESDGGKIPAQCEEFITLAEQWLNRETA